MRKAGARDARLAALALVAIVDGFLLNELIGGHVSAERLKRVLGPLQNALAEGA